MEKHEKRQNPPPKPSPRALRLTFRVSNGKVELVSHERLEMIVPPAFGERPVAGIHGGNWLELRDADKDVLAHRLISPTNLNSVEIHSPDGSIERVFGEVRDQIFEVLLPDEDAAASVALMGEPLIQPENEAINAANTSGELAEFEIPGRRQGGE